MQLAAAGHAPVGEVMRTFKLELSLDLKAVVPDSWVALMRKEVIENPTPFLTNAQEMFPEDDEEFALHILKHGVRHSIRGNLQELFMASGLGCTLSPARATVIDRSPPAGVEPVLASEVDSALTLGSLG